MMPKNPLSNVMVQAAITQFDTVSSTFEVFRTEMNRLAQQLPEYPVVMGLYGVSSSLGPQLIAEIGDVRRFSHKGSLTAFSGVDPVFQFQDKKRSVGKPYYVYITAGCNMFLRIYVHIGRRCLL